MASGAKVKAALLARFANRSARPSPRRIAASPGVWLFLPPARRGARGRIRRARL
jgi:hypothetical protein